MTREEELHEDIEMLRTENAALKERCEKAEDALGCQADLEKDFDDARTENAALAAKAGDMALTIFGMSDENEMLTAQLASARADYAAALSALELANMPKVPEEAMYRAVELLAEANTRAEQAEARVAELEARIEHDTAQTEIVLDAYVLENQQLSDRAERAVAERDVAKGQVIDLEEIVNGVHFLRKQVEAERDALREALEEWEHCARYDAMMEGPRFKGWDRSQMERCRKRMEAARVALAATVPVPRSVPSSPEVHVSQAPTKTNSPDFPKAFARIAAIWET